MFSLAPPASSNSAGRSPPERAHGKDVRMVAGGVAEKFILGITEDVRLAGLVIGAEKGRHQARDVNELTGRRELGAIGAIVWIRDLLDRPCRRGACVRR